MKIHARRKRGRPPKLQGHELEVLRVIVAEHPNATYDQYNAILMERTGISLSRDSLRNAMKRGGIKRAAPTMPVGFVVDFRALDGSYGYIKRKRNIGGVVKLRYGTSLTDAEWALVSEVFEWGGGPGKPPQYPRRWMLDACFYVVRTDCAWRLLPKSFPPWNGVYKLFHRWTAEGRFEEMHKRLRQQWRERADRDMDRSASRKSRNAAMFD